MSRLAMLAVLALSLSGCMGAGTAPDFQVRIDIVRDAKESIGFGHGVLIDKRTVVTVAHVGGKEADYYVSRANGAPKPRYVKAHFVGLFGSTVSVEPLAVLRLDESMYCSRYPELRGVEPGDSGSPILGKRGAVIGFVHGYIEGFFTGRTIMGVNGPIGPLVGKKEED